MTRPVEITLLTQDDCGFCDHAKTVLDRLRTEYPLQITEIDLTGERGQLLAAKAGVLFAPGVLVDGEPFSFGRLSERRLRRALGKHAQQHSQRPVLAVAVAVAATALADGGSSQPSTTSVSTPAAIPAPAPASSPTARHGDGMGLGDGAAGCCQRGTGDK